MNKKDNDKKWDISPRGCKSCDAPEALEETKKELVKCEDWEINKKAELETYLKEVEHTLRTEKKCSPDTRHDYCQSARDAWDVNSVDPCPHCKKSIIIKTNNWNDKFIPEGVEEHDQSYWHKTCWEKANLASNQIKSNQIKSNQIKSNQIKSNQIKLSGVRSILIKPIIYLGF